MRIAFSLIIAIAVLGCSTQTNETEATSSTIIEKIADLKSQGYEIVGYHGHLKGGLTMEQLLAHSDSTGIEYGVAFNAGIGFPITDDSTLEATLNQYKDFPVYMAMQAEGREWVDMFSEEKIAM